MNLPPCAWKQNDYCKACSENKVQFALVVSQEALVLNIVQMSLQADTDKDGRLTLLEMIENPYVFYSAIFTDEDDDDYIYHDEFR